VLRSYSTDTVPAPALSTVVGSKASGMFLRPVATLNWFTLLATFYFALLGTSH
jgi:hypothetical protein